MADRLWYSFTVTWQILITTFLFLGTASYLLRRVLAQKFAKYNRLINGFFFVVALYPIGLVVAWFTHPNLDIGWQNMLLLLAGSAIFPFVNLLSFKASKDVDAGLFTIINNAAPVVTIIVASFLLHETLNPQQMLGAAIIIGATFFVALPNLRRSATNFNGVLLAFAAVALVGVAIVFERWMLTRIDFGAYLVFGWGAQTLWMAIAAWPERRHLKELKDKATLAKIMAYGFINATKGLCFVGALKLSGNASLVVSFTSFTAVLVVLAAYFILNERDRVWTKVGGAIAGAAGLLILYMS